MSGAAEQVAITGSSLHDVVEKLAQRALEAYSCKTDDEKLLIGIAGPPGSGKTTLSERVCKRINASKATKGTCVVVPMDGFHFYRKELDAMQDSEEAHKRRGAHWTFDSHAFVRCIRRIRREGADLVPSFDHGVGDPVPHDIWVKGHHKVVLIEGNYLLLDIPPWTSLQSLLDEIWFVDCPLDVAMERVKQRQIDIGLSPEQSFSRIVSNDRPNAELIVNTRKRANVLIPSDVPLQ